MKENNARNISKTATCPEASCSRSNTCARHANYLKSLAEADTFEMLNIRHLQITDLATCPYHLTAEKQRWARGFRHIVDTIPSGNAKHLYTITPYTQRRFYKARNGEIPIEPKMQKHLLRIFKEIGGDVSVGFDSYEEKEVLTE